MASIKKGLIAFTNVYFIGTSMSVFGGRALVVTMGLIFLYVYAVFDVVRLTRKTKN